MTEFAVQAYLERLERAGAALEPQRRAELVAEITDHISEARARGEAGTPAEMQALLDRLGPPEDIVAASWETVDSRRAEFATGGAAPSGPSGTPWPVTGSSWASPGAQPVGAPTMPSRWGGLEIAAVVLLCIGGFIVPFVGPIVGLILAWISPAWSTAEKWVATGLALVLTMVLPLFALLFLVAA
jgi:hypothetical protein